MIVNIRGTSGSGKSTVARAVMSYFGAEPMEIDGSIEGYSFVYNQAVGHIVGRYTNPCGGCDTVKTQDDVCNRVRAAAEVGHVLFEGLVISTIFERYMRLAEELGGCERFRFVFLNTPLDVCIERIEARRKEAGNTRPLNLELTTNKHELQKRIAEKLIMANQSVMWMTGDNAIKQIIRWFKEPV